MSLLNVLLRRRALAVPANTRITYTSPPPIADAASIAAKIGVLEDEIESVLVTGNVVEFAVTKAS